jgi:DNA-binding NarL/FixJ family response regulator
MTIRVLLVDDQSLLRATFRLLFAAESDIEVVGEAATGAEALVRAREDRADVVLMDIRMPDMDGIEATRLITADESLAGVKILILTTFETDELVIAALRAGASGYLGKGVDPGTLLDAIRTVASGESLLSAAATTSSSVSNVVRISTRTPARFSSAVIRRVASMPSMSGIRMSISTTPGCSSPARATASAPDAASPATSMSGSLSSSIRNVARSSA